MDTPNLNDVVHILKCMQKQLDAFKSSFSFLCKTFDEMKETIVSLSKENESIKEKIAKIELNCAVQEKKIHLMEAVMDRDNQNACKQNIVVVGLPLNCGEIVSTICNLIVQIGVPISNDDILAVQQMNHNSNTKSFLKNSFIVTLKTAEIKNNILSTFHAINNFKFKVDESAYTIFILHHLSKLQSKLYNEAKIIKNKFKFQFLWCKDGKIYLRKSSDSTVNLISSFNDIARIKKSLDFLVSPAQHQNNASMGKILENLDRIDSPKQADSECDPSGGWPS